MSDVDEQIEPTHSHERVARAVFKRTGITPSDLEPRAYTGAEAAEVVRRYVNASKASAAEVTPDMFVTETEADTRVRAELARIAQARAVAELEPSIELQHPPDAELDDARDWRAMNAREQRAEREAFVKRWGIRAWRVRLERFDALETESMLAKFASRRRR